VDEGSSLPSSAASPHQHLEKFRLSPVDTQPPSPLFSEADYVQIWLLQSSPTDIQRGEVDHERSNIVGSYGAMDKEEDFGHR